MKEPRNRASLQLSMDFRSSIWEGLYGNVASQYLSKEWDVIFGIFQLCINSNSDNTENSKRLVIPAPTGTGKTLAMAFYASKLPKDTGMLIVTFLKDEVKRIAEGINKQSGEERALRYHSGLMNEERVNRTEFKEYQILVITHNELKASVDKHRRHGKDNRIKQLYAYKDGHRDLVVIDESIDNIISSKLEHRDVKTILGKLKGLPNHLQKELLEDISALRVLDDMFEDAMDSCIFGGGVVPSKGQKIEIKKIQKKLKKFDFSFKNTRKLFNSGKMYEYDSTYTKDTQNKLREILDGIDAIMETDWAYYYLDYKTGMAQFRTARSSQLEGRTSVVLDATSSINHYYNLQSDVDMCRLISEKVRNYQNVTLYISKKQTTGKSDLCDGNNIQDYAKEIANRVDSDNAFKGSKVAIFTHKCLESRLEKHDSQLKDIQFGHFGNLTGLNSYNTCDVLYIIGLPHKPATVYTDLHALSDTGTDCFNDTKEIDDERKKLENSLVAADVVQMINRVSCRRVIDSKGNCPETTVHMLLPNNTNLATIILNAVQEQMPSIVIKPWDFVLKAAKKPGKASKYEKSFLKELPKDYGESIPFSTITDKLGMKKGVNERFIKRLQEFNDSLFLGMEKKGVVFTKKNGKWMLTKEI